MGKFRASSSLLTSLHILLATIQNRLNVEKWLPEKGSTAVIIKKMLASSLIDTIAASSLALLRDALEFQTFVGFAEFSS